MYEPLKSTGTVCPAVLIAAPFDVDENVTSAGKSLIVTVYAPPGTPVNEYAPEPSVVAEAARRQRYRDAGSAAALDRHRTRDRPRYSG